MFETKQTGFYREKCEKCKKHNVLITDKHKGKIICKQCKKKEQQIINIQRDKRVR